MLSTYTYPKYAYRRPPEIGAAPLRRVPLVVVGAGPVGLAAAIDGAQRGVPVLLLDEDDTVSVGSRGLCYAKRALEVLDRLGVGDRVVAKGVTWNVGRTFHHEREVFRFDLLPESGHRRPGMVNLQQYWLEQFLVERAAELPGIELRWKNRVVGVRPGQGEGGATEVDVETPDGRYTLQADWLVVADGARSPIRRMLGLDIEGKVFQDRFLIADVVMKGELFPVDRTERWFWFDPPFHGGPGVPASQGAQAGTSVLLHREADDVWRIDFQLGWNPDPRDAEAEKQPERVIPRIRALLDQQGYGHVDFELEWVSVYTFQCRRMKAFRHGRVLFTGDAAHQVSPFGARGANSGLQDSDNLMWKLALVMQGAAPERLLDSYAREREQAADENILNSTRATDFITPKSRVSRNFRRAVLTLAAEHPFARGLVNSGRLSVPTSYVDSPLSTPDRTRAGDEFAGWTAPGAPAEDAPWPADDGGGWLLERLHRLGEGGSGFVLMLFRDLPTEAERAVIDELAGATVPVRTLLVDPGGLAARRYDASPGTAYLMRPDQHVAARWRRLESGAARAALARATGQS